MAVPPTVQIHLLIPFNVLVIEGYYDLRGIRRDPDFATFYYSLTTAQIP